MPPYISDVFCEVCEKSIVGKVRWHRGTQDILVCDACHKIFDCERQKEVRRMVGLPWTTLATALVLAAGTVWYVDAWPLVDGIAGVVAGLAAGGLALKGYGKARG